MTSNPPNWCDDYRDAHDRHWEDAELLFQKGRLANADHLYGLSAECGLKAIWPQIIGTALTARERVHIDQLWDRFVNEANNRRLMQQIRISQQNPFANWRSSQRYAHQQNFTRAFVEPHRQAASEIRRWVKGVMP